MLQETEGRLILQHLRGTAMTKLFLQHISPRNYLQQNTPLKTEREAKVFMRPEASERNHHANKSVLHKEERPLQRCSGVQGALLLKRGKAQPQAMPGSGCSSARSPLPDCCPWERAAASAGSGWEKGVRKMVARDQGRGRERHGCTSRRALAWAEL